MTARRERVAIVGSREHPHLAMVRAYVVALDPSAVVVTGGAVGVDTEAEVACRTHGRRVVVWSPAGPTRRCIAPGVDVSRHVALGGRDPVTGRDALLLRNTLIVLGSDRVVLFPDGSRGGCWDTAREAVRHKRPCEVRWVDGRVEEYVGGYKRRTKAEAV